MLLFWLFCLTPSPSAYIHGLILFTTSFVVDIRYIFVHLSSGPDSWDGDLRACMHIYAIASNISINLKDKVSSQASSTCDQSSPVFRDVGFPLPIRVAGAHDFPVVCRPSKLAWRLSDLVVPWISCSSSSVERVFRDWTQAQNIACVRRIGRNRFQGSR